MPLQQPELMSRMRLHGRQMCVFCRDFVQKRMHDLVLAHSKELSVRLRTQMLSLRLLQHSPPCHAINPIIHKNIQ